MTALEIAKKILNREIVIQISYNDLFRDFCEELTEAGYLYFSEGDLYEEVIRSFEENWPFLCASTTKKGRFSSVKHGGNEYGEETSLEDINYISSINHIDISLEEFL